MKVAKIISEVLEADVLRPQDVDPRDVVEKNDVLGFGSGIYYGRPHRSLLKFAENLPKISEKTAFIFSTSGLPRIPLIHDYHKPLIGILREKGFRILGEFTCRGYNTHGILKAVGGMNKGRPSQADLERARKFAEEILDQLRS